MDQAPDVVLLTTTSDEFEAGAIVGALAEHNVTARTVGEATSGFRAEAPGRVQILVPESQLARAREVLAKVQQDAATIDWSQVDVGEPEDV